MRLVVKNNFIPALLIFGAFLVAMLGFINIYLPFIIFGAVLCFYAFYNPRDMIYALFFIMFINGYLRIQTGLGNYVALLIDIIVGCLYAKLLFDCLFQKKLNLVIQAPLFSVIFLFGLYCISRTFNIDISFASKISGLRSFIYYIPLYLVGYFYHFDQKHFKRFVSFFMIMILVLCLYACRQHFSGYTPAELAYVKQLAQGGTPYLENEIRVFSMLSTAVDFSCLLAMCIPMAIPWYFSIAQKYRLLYFLGVIFISSVLSLTFLRSSFVACGLSVLFLFFLLKQIGYINNKDLLRTLGMGSLVGIVLLFSLNTLSFNNDKNLDVIWSRVKSVGAITSFVGITQQSTRARDELYSMYDRLNYWKIRISEVQNVFIGQGVGAQSKIPYSQSAVMDNSYLCIYYDLGLIGVGFFLCLLCGWLMLFMRNLSKVPLLCLMPIGMLVSIMIFFCVSTIIVSPPMRLITYFCIGMFCRKIKEGDTLTASN